VNVDLGTYQNKWYRPGSRLKILLWMLTSALFFRTGLPVPSFVKVFILKSFGARIGSGVVIKPRVNIKYPWKLTIGCHSWLGEGVWIDNLDIVTIGDSCCLSQGCFLLTGNHDFRSSSFDLMISKIIIENGAWVGARAVVCPGVILHQASVLTVSSVAVQNLEEFGIYQGNPAIQIKKRVFT
jgi:putative colanic acid biosynthesis acetyltransferase WcaF